MAPLCSAGRTAIRGCEPQQICRPDTIARRRGSNKSARAATLIFTHNGAPQALVGCYGRLSDTIRPPDTPKKSMGQIAMARSRWLAEYDPCVGLAHSLAPSGTAGKRTRGGRSARAWRAGSIRPFAAVPPPPANDALAVTVEPFMPKLTLFELEKMICPVLANDPAALMPTPLPPPPVALMLAVITPAVFMPNVTPLLAANDTLPRVAEFAPAASPMPPPEVQLAVVQFGEEGYG